MARVTDAMQASKAVLEAAGGARAASLNLYVTGDGRVIVTQQVDQYVYVLGEDFTVSRHGLDAWLADACQPEPQVIDCFDAEGAWELLRFLRGNCTVWQCGACDAWIFTSALPKIGVLHCSTCGDGGVDFRHADRHTGEG
ncbi:hypothetical protein DV701_12275 [Ornithinimicrobium avium]|uniref:Uncharacterized protein n=1 Tax=Ornithinimicrobium avium TaxID=2283195 RepID=A0A345NP29_9MICO|nr:hypothetical protein DV701_12275 [Ornithinimicrobium avium]